MSNFERMSEAKQYLRDNWENGVDCPCCGQFVKKYKDPLNSSRALSLISLYNQSSGWGEHIHISKIKGASGSGGSFAQLKHWGLITDLVNTDTKKRKSGMWEITDKGRAFVLNQIAVPKYMYRFDGKCLGFSEELVTISKALGTKFDYTKLMEGNYE